MTLYISGFNKYNWFEIVPVNALCKMREERIVELSDTLRFPQSS